jgi:outer membrane lipoprotein-sorting protein
MIFENGHIVPTLMTVENLSRKTTTTATFRNLVLDPEIDDRLFSVTVLERNPELRNHTHAKQPR